MSKQQPGESAAVNNSTSLDNQLAALAQSLFGDYNSLALPALKQLYPMLQATAMGAPTAMSTAAQAPVRAQTAESIGQIDQNLGGVTNPDKLIQDITRQGQSAAGLAEDATVSSAVSDLGGLIGQQGSLVGTGASGLSSAAGNQTDIARLLASQPSPFQQVISGISSLAGAYFGLGGLGGGGGEPGAPGGWGDVTTPLPQPGAWGDVSTPLT